MTLTELMPEISPLPYRIGGKIEGTNLHNITVDREIESTTYPEAVALEVWTPDAQYLTHCANHFPALVEALKQANLCLFGAAPVSHTLIVIKEALATAETVKDL